MSFFHHTGQSVLLFAMWSSDKMLLEIRRGIFKKSATPSQFVSSLGAYEFNDTYREEVISMLLDACADVNATDQQGFNGILYSCGSGRRERLRALLQRGIDFEAKSIYGVPPLLQVLTSQLLLRQKHITPCPGIVEEMVSWGVPLTTNLIEAGYKPGQKHDPFAKHPWAMQLAIDLWWSSATIRAEVKYGLKRKRKLRSNIQCDKNPCFNCPELFKAYGCKQQPKTCAKNYLDQPRYCLRHGTCTRDKMDTLVDAKRIGQA